MKSIVFQLHHSINIIQLVFIVCKISFFVTNNFFCNLKISFSYKDHRTPPWDSRPYQTNHDYYVIMVARLAFLIVFEVKIFDKFY
jgi:hypothetical protein